MIEITHLQKVVDNTTVIDFESFSVDAAEITAILGLTEPHKSALIDLLSGQTSPTAGTIRLHGIDPRQERQQFAQIVGLLPADNSLYPKLSTRQNLIFYCDLYGLAHEQADIVLHQVGLQDQAKVKAETLSPSLARRLAFGRAILHAPSILLLIDPFKECDPASIALMKRLILSQTEEGTAVLIITNERARFVSFSTTLVETENGRIQQIYKPEASETQQNLPFKVPARLEGKVALVNPADILYATTEDGRTLLCTVDGRIPTHLTLSDVEERLARSGFFRAHRSYLVNLQHITEVIAYTRDSYTLILDNGRDEARTEIPLSKGAARELRELLDY